MCNVGRSSIKLKQPCKRDSLLLQGCFFERRGSKAGTRRHKIKGSHAHKAILAAQQERQPDGMDSMKRKAAAAALLILAVVALYHMEASKIPQLVRIQPPEPGKAGEGFYYDSSMNPYFPEFAPYHKTEEGYVTGNCTWYAWGRACEIAGKKLPHTFTGNAGTWWEQNQEESWYPFGEEPKRGAIVCYETHVAVVEQEKPLIVSESGWQVEKKRKEILFHCGKPWRKETEIRGYIYIGE